MQISSEINRADKNTSLFEIASYYCSISNKRSAGRKSVENFNYFVCLVYKNYKWPNQNLWFYCIINLPRTAEYKFGLSVKKQRL